MFLVLTSQLFDLALEILVAFQHVPHDDVTTVVAFLGLLVQVGAEMAVGVVLPVSLHLLLQPDVFLDQFLIPSLALLEVIELGGCAEVGLRDVAALLGLAIEYAHLIIMIIYAMMIIIETSMTEDVSDLDKRCSYLSTKSGKRTNIRKNIRIYSNGVKLEL